MAKEKITGAEAMMRSLEYQGVKTLFGYPGGSIMPTFDALYHHKDTLNIYWSVMNRELPMQHRDLPAYPGRLVSVW